MDRHQHALSSLRLLLGSLGLLLASVGCSSGGGDAEREVIDRPVGADVSNEDATTTLLTNARVYPDSETDWVSSVAYGPDGTVLAVGNEDDVVGTVGEDIRILDGATHVVIPGAFLVQDEDPFPVSAADVDGALRAGEPADYTVLDTDPFTASPEQLAAADVLLVVRDGVELYRSARFDR